MSARRVGKGRGAVHAGGRWYKEGESIPDDVKVGDHVFTDVDASVSNMPPLVDTVEPVSDRPARGGRKDSTPTETGGTA